MSNIKLNNNKKGNSVATMPIVLLFCMSLTIIVGMLIINQILPFLWYQKLQDVSQKYMFVIERFGYLTSLEKKQLQDDLIKKGFNAIDIKIEAPESKKEYGQLISLKISYNYKSRYITLQNGFKFIEKITPISVEKYSYSKK